VAAPVDRPPSTAAASRVPGPPVPPLVGPDGPPKALPPPPPPGELTLIGSGHVFQVRDTIHQAIVALRPDIVFVELDRGRLQALAERHRNGRAAAATGAKPPASGPPPSAGFVQKRLQRFQEGVAGMYGADVGEEMLAAVHAGQEVGARIALIDPPADDTVRRVLKELTWRERLRAGGLLVGGTVSGLLRRGKKADIEAEIRRYQEDPAAALEDLRGKFPTLHRIVIAERDAIMARRIAKHLVGARHGVAVVGDGHIPGLVALLGDLGPTVYRLADVREGRLPRPPASLATGTTTEVRFGFDAQA
jgi:pheromone shutdown protein TraB